MSEIFSQFVYAKDCQIGVPGRNTGKPDIGARKQAETPAFLSHRQVDLAGNYAGKLDSSAFEPQSTTPTLSPGRGL